MISERRNAHNKLGEQGERAVAELLRQFGYSVRRLGTSYKFDLLVNSNTTIEVKTALGYERKQRPHKVWQFNLTKNDGQHWPMDEHVLILRCIDEHDNAHHFVIPGALLPKNLTTIKITGHPTKYSGKYSLFLEAWSVLNFVILANTLKAGEQLELLTQQQVENGLDDNFDPRQYFDEIY